MTPPEAERAVIDVVMPAHNEGATIAATLREFHRQVAVADGIPIRFIICEDGSSDDTLQVLEGLRGELPIHLVHGEERKSYSRAVIDGLRAAGSEVVGALDADGQCDPRDFRALLEALEGRDLAIGFRSPRSDSGLRRAMSSAFRALYRLLFRIDARDPSCPYVLIRRDLLNRVLAGRIGILKQGFWWEFLARAVAEGARLAEVPVRHRPRAAGRSRVYGLTELPAIACSHVLGLFRLKNELSSRFSALDGARGS